MARRQTTGRGRSGRTWRSLDGNLHLSVLLRPDTLRHPGHFALMAAVALADATRPHLADPAALRLKWPNDLLLGGDKLAGILLEAGESPRPWLVIGFGLNLRVAPADPARETAAIGKTAPPPELFAIDVLKSLGSLARPLPRGRVRPDPRRLAPRRPPPRRPPGHPLRRPPHPRPLRRPHRRRRPAAGHRPRPAHDHRRRGLRPPCTGVNSGITPPRLSLRPRPPS